MNEKQANEMLWWLAAIASGTIITSAVCICLLIVAMAHREAAAADNHRHGDEFTTIEWGKPLFKEWEDNHLFSVDLGVPSQDTITVDLSPASWELWLGEGWLDDFNARFGP